MTETKPPLESRIGKDSPFTFGQRYLQDENDVFNHNAWDHVEWGEEQIEAAQEMIAKQYEHPVKEFDKKLYNENPAKYWDIFYKNNRENFFKDRKWLQIEFPRLYEVTSEDYQRECTVLEVGCGAGNTMFPILSQVVRCGSGIMDGMILRKLGSKKAGFWTITSIFVVMVLEFTFLLRTNCARYSPNMAHSQKIV